MKRLGLVLAALAMAASLRAASPAEVATALNQANFLYMQKKYDQAIAAYGQTLRLDNTSSSAYQGVGNCFVGKGDNAKALKYYKYALQLSPQNEPLRALVAKLDTAPVKVGGDLDAANQFYRERQYDLAIEAYKKAIAAGASPAKAWQGLGNCYYAKGSKADALASYHKSLEIQPNNSALAAFVTRTEGQGGTQVAQGGGGGWFQPAWRSAIVPGWGQAYNGQTSRGLWLGSLTYGLLIGEIATYMAGMSARDQYLSAPAGGDFNTPYSNWESMATMNHAFYISMTAAYAFTLVDAALGGHSSSGNAMAPSAVQVAFDGQGVQMKAKLLEF